MAAPTGEFVLDYSDSFRSFVDCVLSDYGEEGAEGAYVAINMERAGVRQAIGRLYGGGFLYKLSEFDSLMTSDFNYGCSPEIPTMSLLAKEEDCDFREKLSVSKERQTILSIKPQTWRPESKLGACALSSGQKLSGVGVFARHEGADSVVGIRVHYSRRIYPQGYVLYTQDIFVSSSPRSEPILNHGIKCEVIYERPCDCEVADEDQECAHEPDELTFL